MRPSRMEELVGSRSTGVWAAHAIVMDDPKGLIDQEENRFQTQMSLKLCLISSSAV